MAFVSSAEKLLQRQLSGRARAFLLICAIALTLVVAFLNAQFPASRFSALAFVFLIAIDAIVGFRWGILAAIGIAVVFGASDWVSNAPGLREFAVPNLVARIVVFFLILGLVELIRHQTKALAQKQDERRELELLRLQNQLAESDAHFEAAAESIPFGLWRCNIDGHVTYMSPSFLKMLGATLEEIRAGGWLARVVEEDAERVRRAWRNRDNWSDLWEDEYRIRGADGKLYTILCRGSAVRDESGKIIGWTGVNFDITERIKAREQFRFLAEVGRVLTLPLNPNTIFQRIAQIVVPRYADWCSVEVVSDEGSLAPIVLQHSDPEKLETVRNLRAHQRADESEGVARVLQTGISELHEVISDEQLLDATRGMDDRYVELVRQLGLTSAIVVPLRARGTVFGVMTFAQAESGRHFSAEDLGFIEIVAGRAALAYDNARMYAKEQRVADTFQRASLPTSLPRIPGIKLRARYVPGATEAEIGGDWYDAFLLPSGELAVSIGDVVGKGLLAAVAMVTARQAIRGAALEGSSPKEVLNRVNHRLAHEGGGMVTALMGTLDPVTLQFRFASAGHPSPLVGQPDGSVEVLPSKGPPLGIFVDRPYSEEVTTLQPGSLLVLYTDGLIEFNRNIAEGERTLIEAVKAEIASPTTDSSDSIVQHCIAGAPQDDVAVLSVAVAARPLDSLDLVVPSEPASARVVRQALRRLAIGVGLNEAQTTDLLLASGEAISNVIEHAYGCSVGPLMIRAFRDGADVVVRVSDKGRWRAAREDGSGRGFRLMRALVNRVDIERQQEGTSVQIRMSVTTPRHDQPSNFSAASS